MPHIDSPLQEPHPRHASATIVTTEREYIPPKPPTRNILPRGSPHKRTPIGQRAGVSAVWDWPALVIVVHHNACAECPQLLGASTALLRTLSRRVSTAANEAVRLDQETMSLSNKLS